MAEPQVELQTGVSLMNEDFSFPNNCAYGTIM